MDTEFIIQLLNSPGWLKFIGDRNVKTEDDAKAYLENGPLTSYRENVIPQNRKRIHFGHGPG